MTIGSGGILAISGNIANTISITNGTIAFSTGVANSVVQGMILTDGSASTTLTISAGIRYDLEVMPLSEDPFNPLFSDPSKYPVDKDNFSPRLACSKV